MEKYLFVPYGNTKKGGHQEEQEEMIIQIQGLK